jgi:hypothetical protein
LSASTIWLVLGQREMFSGFLERSNLAYTESQAYEGQRIEMAAIATRLTLTLPVGAGLGGFTYHYLGWDDTRGGFAHNIFLEIGSELGPVGLAAFLALCWSALGPYIRLRGKGRDIPVIGLALVFLFIYMLVLYQFHGDLNDARVLWAWAGALFAFHRHLPAASLRPAAAKRRTLYRVPILSEAGSR